MMKVQLHAEAETEMIEAAAYYESQQTDLGKRFLASVQDSDCCRHASGSPSRLLEGSVARVKGSVLGFQYSHRFTNFRGLTPTGQTPGVPFASTSLFPERTQS